MSLSEEDQLVLERAHWEMAQNLEWSGRRVSVLLDATHFSLTPEEKSSIESDILAKKPIHDAPAYRKLLGLCFPGEEITFPYLPNLDDARIVVSKLSQLF